jgi:hypothetical protein
MVSSLSMDELKEASSLRWATKCWAVVAKPGVPLKGSFSAYSR